MTTIQLRRGTAAQWELVNPILAEGEPGFVPVLWFICAMALMASWTAALFRGLQKFMLRYTSSSAFAFLGSIIAIMS